MPEEMSLGVRDANTGNESQYNLLAIKSTPTLSTLTYQPLAVNYQ
jgi:hypothetical protein